MKDYTIIDFRKYNQQATKLLRNRCRKIFLLYKKNFRLWRENVMLLNIFKGILIPFVGTTLGATCARTPGGSAARSKGHAARPPPERPAPL